MSRLSRSTGLHVPPLSYAGERAWLREEQETIRKDIARLPPSSRFRAGLEYRARQITTRLLALGPEPEPTPGMDRKDLQ